MIAGLRLLEVALLLSTPPDTAWTHQFGGHGEEWSFSAAESPNHQYVAAGHTTTYGAGDRDIWMVAVDEDGDSLWSKTFGGKGEDGVQFITNTKDNGFLLAGFTKSFGAEERDIFLIKTDGSGNLVWQKQYGGSGRDVANCAHELSQGGFLVCGRTESYSNSMDGFIMRLDENGDSLWARTYGGGNYDDFFYITVAANGILLCGTTLSYGGGPYNGWLMMTDFIGDTLWNRSYGGPGVDVLRAVELLPDGEFLSIGYTDQSRDGSLDCWLIRCSSRGDILWSRTLGGPGRDRTYWITQTSDSCFVLTGDTYSYGAGKSDAWLLKVHANGDSLWSKAYGSESEEECFSVIQTSDKGYLLAGRTGSNSAGETDFLLIKTAPDTITIQSPVPEQEQASIRDSE